MQSDSQTNDSYEMLCSESKTVAYKQMTFQVT